jgi:uncharacterized oxidoreductase
MDANNQTILITGGTSGIGLALVNQLSKNNCILVLARSHKKMETLFGSISNIHCYCCDLSSQTAVTQALQCIIKNHPNISIVINNAGIQYTPLFTADDFTLESINEELQVNLHAPLIISAMLIKHWRQHNQQSAIVNISSALAIFPKTSAAVYCATKAALHNFSRALSYQLENTCTHVQEAILPLVDTAMTKGRAGKKISAQMAAAEIIAGICKNKKIIYVGKTKWLPLLMRINPSFVANMFKKY